jgi:protease I
MVQPKGRLKGVKVAVIATDGFEPSELLEPRKALDQEGAQTVVVGLDAGEIHGFSHDKKGKAVKVDRTFEEVTPGEFDGLLLPGGALNADAIRVEPRVQQFVQAMDQAGKPMAVICHAPWILVSSQLVRGRRLTSYFTIQDDVRNAGGDWVDEEVVRDRNWVTSRQPADLPAFNEAMIQLLASRMGNEAEPHELSQPV